MGSMNTSEFLKSHGIKPSLQRIKIYDYLYSTKEHPTVDIIYKALIDDIPTLSKTTVYNTLNLFVESKVALMITIEENEVRYDADTTNHGHFKCQGCNKVIDFPIEVDNLKIKGLENFDVDEIHIYSRGTCPTCKKVIN